MPLPALAGGIALAATIATILATAGKIAETARKLIEILKKNKGEAPDKPPAAPGSFEEVPKALGELRTRIENLEAYDEKQAELIAQIATQFEEVPKALGELRARIENLEAHDEKQAELVAHLATQNEALSRGLQVLAGRTNALLVTSAVAIGVAVVALVLVALR